MRSAASRIPRSRSPWLTARRWARSTSASSTISALTRSGLPPPGAALSSTAPRSARERPKDTIEVLALEATRTTLVAEKAAALEDIAYRLRIMGSLAISLCHLAAGRVDGVCSLKAARAVDIAAAQLLVTERGLAIDLPEAAALRLGAARHRRSFTRGCRRHAPALRGAGLGARCMREVRVGCSGWNYDHWRNGVFYPPRLPPSRWLEFYARHFDTVEVNATFYRLPTMQGGAGLGRWVTTRLRLRGQGEPLPHSHQTAHGPRARAADVLRATRATRSVAEAGPRALAAAGRPFTATTSGSPLRSMRCRPAATASSSVTRVGSPRMSTRSSAPTTSHS